MCKLMTMMRQTLRKMQIVAARRGGWMDNCRSPAKALAIFIMGIRSQERQRVRYIDSVREDLLAAANRSDVLRAAECVKGRK